MKIPQGICEISTKKPMKMSQSYLNILTTKAFGIPLREKRYKILNVPTTKKTKTTSNKKLLAQNVCFVG